MSVNDAGDAFGVRGESGIEYRVQVGSRAVDDGHPAAADGGRLVGGREHGRMTDTASTMTSCGVW
jgi:hypothetical protein